MPNYFLHFVSVTLCCSVLFYVYSATVHIGGSECNIQERNESHIICQTSSHSGSGQFNVKVMLGSDGLAYVSVY